jgi:hypothetical protein
LRTLPFASGDHAAVTIPCSAFGPDLLVAQVWMHFDLVDGRYDVALLHEAPHVRDLKV